MTFRKLSYVAAFIGLSLFAACLHAQSYTSVVVFGDSLSDTGNFEQLVWNSYDIEIPGPLEDYTGSRFTDGWDTVPAARNYSGVWVEQLAATLVARPTIKPSLNGGHDYAYGEALSKTGSSTIDFGPYDFFSIKIQNTGQQVLTYLATKPAITPKQLFIVWSGANDVLDASELKTPAATATAIQAAVDDNIASLQKLIAAGATEILIPNLPPLGNTPKFNGYKGPAALATAAAISYNAEFAAKLATLPSNYAGKPIHLYSFDVFSLFESASVTPRLFGFVNVINGAQGSPVNPDTYLFWDELHPTTAGHHQLAARNLLTATEPSTITLTPAGTSVKTGKPIVLTAKVTGTGATPTGIVTFYSGASPVAAAELNPSGTAEVTLTAGAVSTTQFTAKYSGNALHKSSISKAEAVTITH